MNRLTKYNYFDDTLYLDTKEQIREFNHSLYKKLKTYEDIEEELGVDLITLFKASKNGIFIREQNTKEKEVDFEEVTLDLDNKLLLFRHPRKEIGKGRFISQYGKTWALTKEELQND